MNAIIRSLALGFMLAAECTLSAFADNDLVGSLHATPNKSLTFRQIEARRLAQQEAKRLAQQEARRASAAEERRQALINQRDAASAAQVENDKMKWACGVRSRVADLMTLKYLQPREGNFLVAFKVSGTGDVTDVIVQGEPQAAHRAEELLKATHMPLPPDGATHTISTGVNYHDTPARSHFKNGCAYQRK